MLPRHLYPPDSLMDTNEAALSLMHRFEGFRAEWYRCPAGVLTIGYGSTAKHTPGLSRETTPGPITEAEAARLMERTLVQQYEPAVERLVDVPLTDNEFGALVSFTYNVGAGAFKRSTLRRKLNAGDYEGAASELLKWKYANGKVWGGLLKRRRAEQALFLERPELAHAAEGLRELDGLPPQTGAIQPLASRLPLRLNGMLRRT